MKYSHLKQCLKLMISPFLLFFLVSAHGQTPSSPGSSNNIGGNVPGSINTIGGYSQQWWTVPKNLPSGTQSNLFMFTQSPSYTNTLLDDLFFSNYLSGLGTSTLNPQSSTTVQALNTLLTATSTNGSLALTSTMSQFFPLVSPQYVYSYSNGTVSGPVMLPIAGILPQTAQSNANQSNINVLNLGSLITPTQYDTNQYNEASNAKSFIGYLSNQYNPPAVIDFTPFLATSAQLQQVMAMPTVQQYLYSLRRIAANYSVGLDNLYYLYNERVPQNTTTLLGKQFSSISPQILPQNLQQKASPLALEKWMATYRINSYNSNGQPNTPTPWVSSIENATPATLQRESLYLLAEIRYELFQQRMLQERILATLSAQQLSAIGPQQLNLQLLEQTICQSAPFKGTSACPPAAPEPTGGATSSGSGS